MATRTKSYFDNIDNINDFFALLESEKKEIVEDIKRHLYDQFMNVRDSWLIHSLYDYFVVSGSFRCMEIMLSIPKPHHLFLLDRIHEGLKIGGESRLFSLIILGYVIRKQRSWLHHLSNHSLFKELLKILKTDDSVEVVVSGIYDILALMLVLPSAILPLLTDLFDIFIRVATMFYSHYESLSKIHLFHVHTALFSFFHRLYGMFPSNFIFYLSSRYSESGKDLQNMFVSIIQPMILSVRVHPSLIFQSREVERQSGRWAKMEPHDVMVESSRYALVSQESAYENISVAPLTSFTSTCSTFPVSLNYNQKENQVLMGYLPLDSYWNNIYEPTPTLSRNPCETAIEAIPEISSCPSHSVVCRSSLPSPVSTAPPHSSETESSPCDKLSKHEFGICSSSSSHQSFKFQDSNSKAVDSQMISFQKNALTKDFRKDETEENKYEEVRQMTTLSEFGTLIYPEAALLFESHSFPLSFNHERSLDPVFPHFSTDKSSLDASSLKRNISCPEILEMNSSFKGRSTLSIHKQSFPDSSNKRVDVETQTNQIVFFPPEVLFPDVLSYNNLPSQASFCTNPHEILDKYLNTIHSLKIEDTNVLKSEITLLHCELLYERHRREILGSRNRRTLGTTKSLLKLEEQNKSLVDQIKLLESDLSVFHVQIQRLRRDKAKAEEERTIISKDCNQKLQRTHSEKLELSMKCQRLQEESKKMVIEIYEQREDLDKIRSENIVIHAELKILMEREEERKAQETECLRLRNEILILGELVQKYTEQLNQIQLRSHSIKEKEIYKNSFETQINALQSKLDRKTLELETFKIRNLELETNLAKKDGVILKKKELLARSASEKDEIRQEAKLAYFYLVKLQGEAEETILELKNKLSLKTQSIHLKNKVSRTDGGYNTNKSQSIEIPKSQMAPIFNLTESSSKSFIVGSPPSSSSNGSYGSEESELMRRKLERTSLPITLDDLSEDVCIETENLDSSSHNGTKK